MDKAFPVSFFLHVRRSAIVFALGGLVCSQALASDGFERKQLALVIKQLENAQQVSSTARKQITPTDADRFWFDYERMERDLKKIQHGIEHYLTPDRAQPRELHGDVASSYTRDRRELKTIGGNSQ